MKLSTRSRYGLKAVVDLAPAYGGTAVPLGTLAAMQGVSEPYLEQLLGKLKRAGIVTATRGVGGGYTLSRAPEEISVQEVLSTLEGSTALTDCVDTGGGACKDACVCSARPLFLKLQSRIDAVLCDTSIRDLADDHQQQKRRIEHAKGLS